MLDYNFVIRCTLDVDMINATIDLTSEEETPLNNCLALLHEIIVNSTNYDETINTFNFAFKGRQELDEDIKKFFVRTLEPPVESVKAMIAEFGIVLEKD